MPGASVPDAGERAAPLPLRPRRVPVLLQQESNDCAAACIAMVAAYHGRHVGLAGLARRLDDGGRGVTFKGLLALAAELRLNARPLRVPLADIRRLALPAILHWEMTHFVVLVRCGRRRAVIHDPASGRRTVDFRELDRAFSGVALELAPQRDFRPQRDRDRMTFADFAGSFRRLWRYLGLMLALLLVTQVLALAPPVATQILVDELVLGQDRRWLYAALAGLLLIMLTGTLLEGLRRRIALFAGLRLAIDSTVSVMSHLLHLPPSFVARRHPGDLMSKVESLNPLRQALSEQLVEGVVHVAVLGTTLAIMLLYSGWLTAVALAGFALSIMLLLGILPAMRRAGEQAIVHTAAQNSSLLESLRGFDTVHALGLAPLRLQRWQKHFLAASGARLREGRLAIVEATGNGVVAALEQVAFLGVGVAGVLDREITLGVLFAFMTLRGRFGSAALGLAEAAQQFFLLKVHTRRLSDIVLAETLPANPQGAVTAAVRGALCARNLRFAYRRDAPIVREFSCDIHAGAHVVIAGPSGCGKTTLLKLLAGLLPASSGQVYVDGTELSLWHREALRSQMGFVLQNDALFQGSIAQNISAFEPEPDLLRVREAAVAADVWNDIQQLPMRLETVVGDMGGNLSGGQVQRLVLARALYRTPAILFLDEATSHLDVRTERRVLGNIRARGITVVSVAHRPDAIGQADQVIHLAGAGQD